MSWIISAMLEVFKEFCFSWVRSWFRFIRILYRTFLQWQTYTFKKGRPNCNKRLVKKNILHKVFRTEKEWKNVEWHVSKSQLYTKWIYISKGVTSLIKSSTSLELSVALGNLTFCKNCYFQHPNDNLSNSCLKNVWIKVPLIVALTWNTSLLMKFCPNRLISIKVWSINMRNCIGKMQKSNTVEIMKVQTSHSIIEINRPC